MKNIWKTLIVTSLIILLPIAAGVILWDQLPEQIPSPHQASSLPATYRPDDKAYSPDCSLQPLM